MKPRARRSQITARQLRRARARRWLKAAAAAIHSALDTPDVRWFSLSLQPDDITSSTCDAQS